MDRRKKKIGSGKQPRYIAEEILEDILLKQPVKTLLRFQSVSKAWASLIGSDRFIKIHLQNSRENPDLTSHWVIYDYLPDLVHPLVRKLKTNELKQYSVHSLMNDPVPDPSGLENLTDFGIVGCCNGLVCIRKPSQKSFSLWNPSTGIWIQLPKLEPNSVINRSGFGWDESSGAYKVFVFLYNTNICRVYSSNTNEWESIETNPHPHWGSSCRKEEGLLLNGKLHWHGDEGGAVVIISLELKSAVIGVMDNHPCDCQRFYQHRLSLGVLGGCLSSVHHDQDYLMKHQFDVWVMKEYGVKESWLLVMAVDLDPFLQYPYNRMPVDTIATVLGKGSDGEILISYGSIFFAHHPKKDLQLKEIKRLKGIKEGARAHLYFETLVSPKTILEQHAQP